MSKKEKKIELMDMDNNEVIAEESEVEKGTEGLNGDEK